jgi:predicted nucleic acid-binding protein
MLIDTNVILDWLLTREPFWENSYRIIELCASSKMQGYLAAHTILNAFYIARTKLSVRERIEMALKLCNEFEIIDIDREMMVEVLKSEGLKDLEDGLQMQCALNKNLDYIITRDIEDFKDSAVKAVLPEEFLALAK